MKHHWLLGLAGLLFAAPAARAEHATIELRAIRIDPDTGQTREEVSAGADRDPPPQGYNPRPVLTAKANEPLVLQFILTNAYPHGENKGVVVRYFIARETELRQKELPDPARGTITEGRFKMNFKPKCRVGARVVFTPREPGVYLLRIDTENTNSDHEHFAAIDLQIE